MSPQKRNQASAFPFLSDIVCHLKHANLLQSATCMPEEARTLRIEGAACDSREVVTHNLFICKGAALKEAFIEEALRKGAVALMCAPEDEAKALQAAAAYAHGPGVSQKDARTACSVPVLVVSALRRAMAEVSALAWGYPDKEMKIIGVTGTKGKSTTTSIIKALIDEAEKTPARCALLGTHHIFDGRDTIETQNTTPESPDLWRHLYRAFQNGCRYVVMEVSSQGLKYERTWGLSFDVACFLNFGNDHISPVEHPSLEDYFESKMKIFDHAKRALFNLDSERVQEIEDALTEAGIAWKSISLANEKADFYASAIRSLQAPSYATQFVAHTPDWEETCSLSLMGEHNVFDAIAAIACVQEAGLAPRALKAVVPPTFAHLHVPGRMEMCSSKDKKLVCITDYAHNELSFECFFETVKGAYPTAFIIALFGVSGGKALNRYHDLPTIASRYADYIVLTSDDPGPIDPAELIDEIAPFIAPETPYEKEPDRDAAIDKAFEVAQQVLQGEGAFQKKPALQGDDVSQKKQVAQVVLCALGKGDEATILVRGKEIPHEPDFAHLARLIAGYDKASQL